MTRYEIDIQKIKPWEKKGKSSYSRGVVAQRMIVSEKTRGKPSLVTEDYIDYLIKKHKMKRAIINKKIRKLLQSGSSKFY